VSDTNEQPILPNMEPLKATSDKLGQLDDEIRAIIATIETVLAKHITSRVSVPFADYTLAFGKISGAWRLVIEVSDRPEDDKPLASASRETRSTVLREGQIPMLITAARGQLDAALAESELALESGRALLAALVAMPADV
jgi:hypothetical protein